MKNVTRIKNVLVLSLSKNYLKITLLLFGIISPINSIVAQDKDPSSMNLEELNNEISETYNWIISKKDDLVLEKSEKNPSSWVKDAYETLKIMGFMEWNPIRKHY